MNKNSTQKEVRNFVSKISDFLKMLPVLPANQSGAGNFIWILYKNPVQLQPVFKSANFTFINFINKRQSQSALVQAVINRY
jgi:hypothetical protein